VPQRRSGPARCATRRPLQSPPAGRNRETAASRGGDPCLAARLLAASQRGDDKARVGLAARPLGLADDAARPAPAIQRRPGKALEAPCRLAGLLAVLARGGQFGSDRRRVARIPTSLPTMSALRRSWPSRSPTRLGTTRFPPTSRCSKRAVSAAALSGTG